MKIISITEDFSVSPQIWPRDVAEIVALGFRSIMCNRPDGEDPGQPDFVEIEAAAKAHGLATAYLPVISGVIFPEDAAAVQAALARLPAPVFAYCRSGARCQNLWSLAR